MPISDYVHLGLMLFLRGFLRAEPALLAYGMSCLGLTLLVLDSLHPDPAMFLHSHVCSDSTMSTYGMA